ncbi:TnsD family Tn7-like transposition protein [Pseudomonas mohnii]
MTQTSDNQRNPILRWFDDETFYSICSRQHRYLSHLDTNSTLRWLYGNGYKTITHDFPNNFNSLNPLVSATWGDALSIIHNHTILNFFCPFQTEQRIEEAVQVLKGPQLGSLKYRLGLLTGKFGAEHPLKACITCMDEDNASRGVAYWHLTHQYPGMILCPTHGTILNVSKVNRQWSGIFEWALPSTNLLHPCTQKHPTSASNKALSNLGISIVDLVKHYSLHFDPDITREIYKAALNALAWPGVGQAAALKSFATFVSLLQPFPPFTSLPTGPRGAAAFLHSMTRKPRSHCHPLKHLVMINWLFGEFSKFIEAYDILTGLRSQEFRSHTIDHTTRLSQETEENNNAFLVKKRPKKLKPPLRTFILEELRSGISKSNVCSNFSISISTVNRILKSEPAVERIRKDLSFKVSRTKHRETWSKIIMDNPTLSPTLLRKKAPASYQWLYRYERDWLFKINGNIPSGRLGNNCHVNWNERDHNLAHLVIEIINNISDGDAKSLSRCELCDLIPGFSRALESPRRFPTTQAIIMSKLNL